MANNFWSDVGSFLQKNDTKILTGFGVAGLLGACVATGFATVRAIDAVNDEKERLGVDKLDTKTTLKVTWKYYVGPAAMAAASATAIICSDVKDNKAKAGLGAALAVSEQTVHEMQRYKEEVIKTIGEKKEEEIEQKLIEEKVKENDPLSVQLALLGPGLTLMYEPITNQYGVMKLNDVQTAINNVNADLIINNHLSVNEYIYELMKFDRSGEMRMDPKYDRFGWRLYSKDDQLAKDDWGYKLNEDTGVTAVVIRLRNDPTSDYQKC